MTGRFLSLAVVAGLLAAPCTSWSYDEGLAESYTKLFAPVQGAAASKALHVMSVDAFVDAVKAGDSVMILDVRTPAEMAIFTAALPDSLTIPMNELFKRDNLARLPDGKKIVVLCATGARAIAAGTALRHVGFENVFILKGGFKALSEYLNPKTASAPVKPKAP